MLYRLVIRYLSAACILIVQRVGNRHAREIEMLERRKFLTALSATMLTAAIPSGTLSATLRKTGQCCSLRKQFAQLVGSDFRLLNAAGVAQKARLVAGGAACIRLRFNKS